MTTHEEIWSLAEILDMTPEHNDGWPVLDALDLSWQDLTILPDLKTKPVLVIWPEHCLFHQFTGDPSYQWA